MQLSVSERNGIDVLNDEDLKIYSVGISTAGVAEAWMAKQNHKRHIIASTIDFEGANCAQKYFEKCGVENQIYIKIEDVSKPLPYCENSFDYIYARLVLHYLSHNDLLAALQGLHRILKVGGKLFIVVRSTNCFDAKSPNSKHNPITGMTTYTSQTGNTYSRYFHTPDSIKQYLSISRYSVEHLKTYKEQLCSDFERTKPTGRLDDLIEVLAYK